jgi:hypothetical protein
MHHPAGAAIIPALLRQPAHLTALPDLGTFIDRLGIRGIQVSLQRSDLWREAALLERLLYKNKHQHRGSHYFTKLQEVGRISQPPLPGPQRTAAHCSALLASPPPPPPWSPPHPAGTGAPPAEAAQQPADGAAAGGAAGAGAARAAGCRRWRRQHAAAAGAQRRRVRPGAQAAARWWGPLPLLGVTAAARRPPPAARRPPPAARRPPPAGPAAAGAAQPGTAHTLQRPLAPSAALPLLLPPGGLGGPCLPWGRCLASAGGQLSGLPPRPRCRLPAAGRAGPHAAGRGRPPGGAAVAVLLHAPRAHLPLRPGAHQGGVGAWANCPAACCLPPAACRLLPAAAGGGPGACTAAWPGER